MQKDINYIIQIELKRLTNKKYSVVFNKKENYIFKRLV